MPARNVIVEYHPDPELARQASASARSLEAGALGHLLPATDIELDPGFAPVGLPAADGATYILRGELDEAQIEALRAHEAVAGVFSDPVIQPCLTCIDSPPLGDDADVAVLRPPGPIPFGLAAQLSDAIRAYAHLQELMSGPDRPRALVVSNSWGMFHPSWDLPPGQPGNYSDNPNHPFNRSVGALAALGADILFAAGNCGPQCPDGRCQGVSATRSTAPAVTRTCSR